MSKIRNQNTLLDDLLNNLFSKPKLVLIFILIFINLWLCMMSLFLGVAGAVILYFWPRNNIYVLIFGLLLLILEIITMHLDLLKFIILNKIIWFNLLHGNYGVLFNFRYAIYFFPLALIDAGLLIYLSAEHSNIRLQLKNLAKGKAIKKLAPLHHGKLQHRLNLINNFNYLDGCVLGVDIYTGEAVKLADRALNLHTLAVGTTGSGKTTTISNIIESVIIRGHPLFYLDGKGDLELAQRVKDFALKNQRKFYLFSMIGESVAYNPLASGGYTSKKDRIIELRNWSEDHYRKISENFLQTVFYILEQTKTQVDLPTLNFYCNPDNLLNLARSQKNFKLLELIEQLSDKVAQVSSLLAEIDNLIHSEIGHLFKNQVDLLSLAKALSEKAIVYFCLQPLAFPAYAETLGKLIINDLKCLIAEQLGLTNKLKIFTNF